MMMYEIDALSMGFAVAAFNQRCFSRTVGRFPAMRIHNEAGPGWQLDANAIGARDPHDGGR